MEYLQFSSFTENDFDEIIIDAGGRRYTDDLKIQELNCDYILDDAVIELKIIEEEPLGKKEKQQKFIELFSANADTVILYPSEEQKYKYFRILESPIQKALKKASKQLQQSAKEIDAKVRIAIIMNNGLYMVSKDEFKEMAIKRVKNDTSGIDILIICSMYYYSDTSEMRVFFDFNDNEINKVKYSNTEQLIDKLKTAWNKKVEQYMTEQLINPNLTRNKEPIKDLFFEYNGVRYIKPPIQWGENSEFWKNGRPRKDTTKENDLPRISVVPIFDEKSYLHVKHNMQNNDILQNSLIDYIKWVESNPIEAENKIQLMVYIELNIDDFKDISEEFDANNIQQLANVKYEEIYKNLENEMIEYPENLECDNFILLEIHEIGMDKVNDIAFISYITDNSRQEYFIDGVRMKSEYASALAISLCMVLKAEKVYLIRNEGFKWK